jgi:hypothetical protein
MLSWFNSLLFPLAAAARLAGRVTGKEGQRRQAAAEAGQQPVRDDLRVERYALGRLPLPPGVSLVAIVSRR